MRSPIHTTLRCLSLCVLVLAACDGLDGTKLLLDFFEDKTKP
jgi:hypothetical protein